MEYAGAKRLLKERLERMDFDHEMDRSEIRDKNKLLAGEVDAKFVLDKINKYKKKIILLGFLLMQMITKFIFLR